MIRVVLTCAIALGACSSKSGPAAGSGSGSGSGSGAGITLTREDMPDDGWSEAALAVGKQWQESFSQLGVQRAVLRPLKSPGGAVVPYLFTVEAEKDGKQVFKSTALVWKGALLNTAGSAKASAYLASLGFPKEPLDPGHLVEILVATRAVQGDWLRAPSVHGWTDAQAATVEYAGGTATVKASRPGGSITLTFAADASFKTQESRP